MFSIFCKMVDVMWLLIFAVLLTVGVLWVVGQMDVDFAAEKEQIRIYQQ